MTRSAPHPIAVLRLRLQIAYDGTEFSGWAQQPGRRTVQQVLQHALATVLRLPDVALTVAGRTDAGVHALGQVAHVDIPAENWPAHSPLPRLAGVLPPDVRVTAIDVVSPDFDARFSALWRRYHYRVCDAVAGVEPLRRQHVLHYREVDAQRMNSAAALMLGLRDFAAFCKRRPEATTIRTLQQFTVTRDPLRHNEILFDLTADAFCHSMVRSLVGALLRVGEGSRPVEWPAQLLSNTVRESSVMVVPPHGLVLMAVGYPNDAELARRAAVTRNRRE